MSIDDIARSVGDEATPPHAVAATPAHPRHPLIGLLLRQFSVAEGSTILMVAFLISAGLGVVRQMLLNRQFGLNPTADAYHSAFRLPETIATLLTGGTLANAMIPVLLGVAYARGSAAEQRLVNLVATTLLVVITPLVLLGIAVAPWFVDYVLAPGFNQPTRALTALLTRILMLELLLVVVVSVATAVLISRNQFLLPGIAIAVHNLTLIIGILVTMLFPQIGIFGPAIGAVCDALLQLAILLPGLWWQNFRYRPVWNLHDADLREVIRLIIPNGLSSVVNYGGGIVDNRYASLAQEGSVTALYNAFLLIGVPTRLFGVAIGQAAFPRMATYVVERNWRAVRRTALWATTVALALGAVTIAGLWLFGRLTIRILFEGGEFDAAAGDLTFALLLAYALALPAAIATEILTRGLIALHDTRTPLLINTGNC
ncbi:MAG: murein biosynthesis integral membrane protein MurJ [Chloroflexaceae bacterium]|nr:murein biosynthesis integral membrane protein MurJ [Chloroflexaceae bacterium]